MKLFKKYILFVLVLNLGVTVHAQDSITLVSQLPITGLPIHDIYGYTHPTTGVKYALLCASNSGLRVIDLSDLSNPNLVGSIQGGGVEPIDVKVWGNYAYVISESSLLLGKIIDLSDPTNPLKVGTFPAAHNITISDSGYMYLSAPGLRIMDLNIDPINPMQVYFDNSCAGHDISIIGNRLYDFPGNCGTRIYDVSQPDTLVLIGSLPAGGYQHSGWTTEDINFLFVCDELAKPLENDITVWDISDLNNPIKVDSFADPSSYVHNFYVKAIMPMYLIIERVLEYLM